MTRDQFEHTRHADGKAERRKQCHGKAEREDQGQAGDGQDDHGYAGGASHQAEALRRPQKKDHHRSVERADRRSPRRIRRFGASNNPCLRCRHGPRMQCIHEMFHVKYVF